MIPCVNKFLSIFIRNYYFFCSYFDSPKSADVKPHICESRGILVLKTFAISVATNKSILTRAVGFTRYSNVSMRRTITF